MKNKIEILNGDVAKEYVPRNSSRSEFYIYTIQVGYFPDFDHEYAPKEETFLCESKDNDSRRVLIEFLKELRYNFDGEVISVTIKKVQSVMRDSKYYLVEGEK